MPMYVCNFCQDHDIYSNDSTILIIATQRFRQTLTPYPSLCQQFFIYNFNLIEHAVHYLPSLWQWQLQSVMSHLAGSLRNRNKRARTSHGKVNSVAAWLHTYLSIRYNLNSKGWSWTRPDLLRQKHPLSWRESCQLLVALPTMFSAAYSGGSRV